MDYRPDPGELRHLQQTVLDSGRRLAQLPPFAEVDDALGGQILDEAARFVGEVIAPLNRIGDEAGCRFEAGAVTTPPGFVAAYRAFREAGWPALSADVAHGGQGLPALYELTLYEWLAAANHGFTMAPGLLHGAYECLRQHGSAALQARYLAPLAHGEWLATMCLTEAQAGSDLGQVRTRATPQADGSLRLAGSKIFISGGEHDLTDNIIHLVLCRLPGSPAGPKGLSLALAPKRLPDGRRNAIHCERIEEKMGLHGSPTCALRFDEASGWLVGEPGRGLAAMFVMMNAARLFVALQGIGTLDAAWQKADAYARERRQMRAPGGSVPGSGAPGSGAHGNVTDGGSTDGGQQRDGPSRLVEHPAIARILDTQRAWIDGARVIAYRTAVELDIARHHPDEARREAARQWCGFVTPVLKAACTRQGFDGASDCLQVFGGHGYIRESGIEQHVRDIRVAMLYEGTNEIQAIDLLVRKVLPDRGAGITRTLLALRDELEAADDVEADAQRRIAGLRYLTLNIADAAAMSPRLPYEVADDYLRVVMLTLLAWAWARIDRADAGRDDRWRRPAAAFRRWILPEVELRSAIIKSACAAATGRLAT